VTSELLITFGQVAGTKLLNKYIHFDVNSRNWTIFTENPKFCRSSRFHGKTTHSAARLRIPLAAESYGP